jgi:hypothetical protein
MGSASHRARWGGLEIAHLLARLRDDAPARVVAGRRCVEVDPVDGVVDALPLEVDEPALGAQGSDVLRGFP